MLPLEELVDAEEPGMPLVHARLAEASNPVELLACEAAAGETTLVALQVTTRSPMGAIAHGTGGLLVDRGWVRVLGAGCPRLPRSLASWNALGTQDGPRLPGALIIADDAVGGFYALNCGALAGTRGHVAYYAPDSLAWEDLEMGYSDWLSWLATGDLARFYENARWPGWEAEVLALSGHTGLSIYPFLWTAGPPVEARSRRPVPLEELWALHVNARPDQVRA